jgi:2,4-dienoyl-CoA reductase-like NADH-dependent reductase (Old Yellow Enzyme family)
VYLLRDVENYLNHKNISAARFGRDAMGDPRFVFDLRRGREPRARTVRRVQTYLEQTR